MFLTRLLVGIRRITGLLQGRYEEHGDLAVAMLIIASCEYSARERLFLEAYPRYFGHSYGLF